MREIARGQNSAVSLWRQFMYSVSKQTLPRQEFRSVVGDILQLMARTMLSDWLQIQAVQFKWNADAYASRKRTGATEMDKFRPKARCRFRIGVRLQYGILSFLSGLIPQEKVFDDFKPILLCHYCFLRFWGDCCELTDFGVEPICAYTERRKGRRLGIRRSVFKSQAWSPFCKDAYMQRSLSFVQF